MTDFRPCRMTHEAIERITTNLRPNEDPAASWVTRKWNWQVPRPFLTVKSGRGTCRFQWRVGPSYCKYSGVTYDLLVSNIGGTYDLADQLSISREFGHFLVVSQSQVPRKSGVNLSLLTNFGHISQLMEKTCCCNSIAGHQIDKYFAHHSCRVSHYAIKIWMRTTLKFHQIWIMIETPWIGTMDQNTDALSFFHIAETYCDPFY